ncbi:MAG: hypothetical protein HKN26_14435 [Acidimicrobiales bacterium]|nr:hypothetical protein [Acidimicrobiales bacterium]
MRFSPFTPTKHGTVVLLAAMLTLGACGSDASEPGENPGTTPPTTPVETTTAPEPGPKGKTAEKATDYIGLSEADAEALADENDVPLRVVHRDGEDFAVTLDYQEDRVNITVIDDIVTDATYG